MPKQIVNKKETPVMIKAPSKINSSAKIINNYIQNKNEGVVVGINNNNNNSNNSTNGKLSNQSSLRANMTGTFGNKFTLEKEKEQNFVNNESIKETHALITRNSKKILTLDEKER
jgi:predicted membrane GTPase involved in stress response